MLPEQKLDVLLDRHAVIEREMGSGLEADAYVKLSREFAELSPVVDTIKDYRAVESELSDLAGLIADYIGVEWAIFGGGLVMLVYAIWAFAKYPEVRAV